MIKFNLSDFTLAIGTLLRDDRLKSVVVYQLPLGKNNQRVKATKVAKNKGDIKLTFGRLNYKEREYLKKCKKQKVTPKKVVLTNYPVKKKK